MQIQKENYPLPVSKRLIDILTREIGQVIVSTDNGVCINFRDTSYATERGGFHPVEIAIDPDGRIRYVTDFAFVGRPPMVDLVKEIDFDFSQGIFEHFGTCYPIRQGGQLFRIWQSNFCDYWKMGVFDDIRVREGL